MAPNAGSPEAKFWGWFRENSPAILKINTGMEPEFEELRKRLAEYDEGLTFELGPWDLKTKSREFTLSAQGNVLKFPKVEKLFAAAPPLERWQIFAFRQRKDLDLGVQVAGMSLFPEEFKYVPTGKGQQLDLDLYVPELNEQNRKELEQATWLILDIVLGEYDLAMRLDNLKLQPQSQAPQEAKALPQLREDVDALKGPVQNGHNS
ncbi:MAG: hypothetical protein ACOCX1_03370 [Fimbriimonadaceae bacterium]